MLSGDGEAHTHLSSQDILHSLSVSNLYIQREKHLENPVLFLIFSKVSYIQTGLQKTQSLI